MRAGIDIGGTFTDLVTDAYAVRKVPSTPDPSDGFRSALEGLEPSAILHGTTVATNAVLERRGARLGFVTTEGFRHLLHLARQDRRSLYDMRTRRPAPLVGRELCVGVPERVGPSGEVLRSLDEDAARSVLRTLRGRVDAVAVCLLHAYANPAHERAVAALAAEELPGIAVSLSSDVLPEFREYERASTTAMNAYVQPVMSRYLEALGRGVAVMRSGGGLRSSAVAVREPVHTLLSGPAAGVLGAAWAAARAGFIDLVTLDMGGTSADVALVEGGSPQMASDPSLDGLPFRTPCLDVVSVGAGGGSVARLDAGGALRVGPRSAGAVPGPACYGRGGTEPTVTDAHAVLGQLDTLAGGTVPLDPGAAERAIGSLGLGLRDGAAGVLRVVRATMTRAIRSVSVERGKDVRRYTLVAFGGAGPLHGCALADELGISTVLVPPAPGALAALGLLVAPHRAELSRTVLGSPDVRAELDALASGAVDALRDEGAFPDQIQLEADLRYAGQSHELRLPWSDGVMSDFHGAHARRYGFSRPDVAVEIVTVRASAVTAPEPLELEVGSRAGLRPRERLDGPAVVREEDTTIVVEDGWTATLDPSGCLVLRR